MDRRLFPKDVGLFSKDIGLFARDIGLFWKRKSAYRWSKCTPPLPLARVSV